MLSSFGRISPFGLYFRGKANSFPIARCSTWLAKMPLKSPSILLFSPLRNYYRGGGGRSSNNDFYRIGRGGQKHNYFDRNGVGSAVLLVFGIGFGSYLYSAITESNRERDALQRQLQNGRRWLNSLYSNSNVSNRNRAGTNVNSDFTSRISDWWNEFSLGQKTVAVIVAVNVVVFGFWQIPKLHGFLSSYFVSSVNAPVVTLLTSVFSHSSPLHLFFNMYALVSLGSMLADHVLGPEHFLHVYLTSGIVAASASRLKMAYSLGQGGSIGASGALYALLGILAHFPSVKLNIIFIPNIPADLAFWGLMLMDSVALVAFNRASSLDHAAHLAGGLFGYFYYAYLKPYTWDQRRGFLQAIGYPWPEKKTR